MTPAFFGKKKSRDQVIRDLSNIMENVRVQFDLSKGDMPDPTEFARCLENFPDFGVFPSIDHGLIRRLDRLIEEDIPDIVNEGDIIASEVRLGGHKIDFEVKLPKNVVDEPQQSLEEYGEALDQKQSLVSGGCLHSCTLFELWPRLTKFSCIAKALAAKE